MTFERLEYLVAQLIAQGACNRKTEIVFDEDAFTTSSIRVIYYNTDDKKIHLAE